MLDTMTEIQVKYLEIFMCFELLNENAISADV